MSDQSGDELTRGELAQRLHRNPEWYDGEAAECCICGRDAVPVSWDGVFIPTPNGSACLSLKDPSCLTCRVDAAQNLMRRGLNQQSFGDFGGEADAD